MGESSRTPLQVLVRDNVNATLQSREQTALVASHDDVAQLLLDHAKVLTKDGDAEALGDAGAKLLAGCEKQLRALIKAQAECEAQKNALYRLPGRIEPDETTPADLEEMFLSLYEDERKQRFKTGDMLYTADKNHVKLRKLIDEGGAAEEMEEDEVVMTQQEVNTKCCITLREMTEKGEYRPMVSKACGHTCSFAGLQEQTRRAPGGKINCPFAGCSVTNLTMKDFKEDKEMAKFIKRRDAEMEED